MNPLILAAALLSMPMEITAYTHTGNRTASGVWPREGMVACARRWPFGTRFEIPGVGIVTCTDRGGAIGRGKLDLFVGSRAEARSWGRRTLQVRVLTHLGGPRSPNEARKGVGAVSLKFTGRNDPTWGAR